MTAGDAMSSTEEPVIPTDAGLKTVTMQLAGVNVAFTIGDGSRPKTGRQCGACALCCKLMPVLPLAKKANERCRLSRHKAGGSCTVYGTKALPACCTQWSCRWLLDQAMAVPRPDRSHYVVDVLPDRIFANGQELPVVQIWCDPAFPNAHRDRALRAWIRDNARQTGMAALVRFAPGMPSLVLAPPEMCANGRWLEKSGQLGDGVSLWS